MTYESERKFEEDLINLLVTTKGWEGGVIKNATEDVLLKNWADILYKNNRTRDRLDDYPLTDGEMQQIVEQINKLHTPLRLNGFVNGKSVTIKRDNEEDKAHFGKEVSLEIYDRDAIAAGKSCYQIAEQPKFKTRSPLASDRRGDFMLLINGMPLIHVELKRSNVHVSEACRQIEKYTREGVFSQGIFSLVQIFVAMSPEDCVYFANPGAEGKFDKNYYFHWADFNNLPVKDWQDIADRLLYIPMAHQLIGFYTVADDKDGKLKVLRSYQYYAANAIADKVAKTKWDEPGHELGGYVWHTTGSGKTLTSFKAAQLIANSKDADKVVFLVDRIELGTQSLGEYRNFANADETVNDTEDTDILLNKLASEDPTETLIVTSIQKLSRIKADNPKYIKQIEQINKKRVVLIIDECHRSTFGDMLTSIKTNFPNAVRFGFTGTPIVEENKKFGDGDMLTADVFGNELHRYIITDGIRDKNVLGFDPYMVQTYNEAKVREKVGLWAAKAETVQEAVADGQKREIFMKFMKELPMAGLVDANGEYVRGVEDYLPEEQYERDEHKNAVVQNMVENWTVQSVGGKFHAIFAVKNIPSALDYYERIKSAAPDLKVTVQVDASIDNDEGASFKEETLISVLEDYNSRYGMKFTMANYASFKRDVANRLAHKEPYRGIENTPEKQIDLLIVVNQMLTGYDSKWINTLYLDKMLHYENVIQAFSRTNRIFGIDKPYGTIKYYRRPFTMKNFVDKAFEIYSGDKKFGMFVDKLGKNVEAMNYWYCEIKTVFENAGVPNFEKLPEDNREKAKFAEAFRKLNERLQAAKIQGFAWSKTQYDSDGKAISIQFGETIYEILLMRYKELHRGAGTGGGGLPFEIDTNITEIPTGKIDTDYMNSRFERYIRKLQNREDTKDVLDALHKTFATLTQEEQKYANLLLHDIERGDFRLEEGKTFRDYLTEYMAHTKTMQIRKFAHTFGIDENALAELIKANAAGEDINAFGRFEKMAENFDKAAAKKYFEAKENCALKAFQVTQKFRLLVREFIAQGAFEL